MLTEEAIVEQIQVDPEMMTVLAIIRGSQLSRCLVSGGRGAQFHLEPALENQGLMRRQIWIWSLRTLRSAMRRLSRSSRN